MMGWGLLIPRGWPGVLTIGGVLYGLIGSIRLEDTVTIGSILVAAVVIIAGGVFTFKNNMRTFWRNLAEERAEQIKVLEQHGHEKDVRIAELQEHARVDLAKVADEQRTVRHELKNQIAALTASLRIEQEKTDLSALVDQLAIQHREAMERMEEGLNRQARMLELLETRVPPPNGDT